jgi:hypothetical protein
VAVDLETQAHAEFTAGRLTEAAGHLLAAVRVGERGAERDRRLLTAVGVLVDVGDAARARAFAGEISALPPSWARSLKDTAATIASKAGLSEQETWRLLRGNAISCYRLDRYGITQ